VTDRRRVPLRAALRGRHAGLVQARGEPPRRATAGALSLDPPHHSLRHRRRTAEPDAPCAFFTASASLVRCEIGPRSNRANVASMFAIASPVGVIDGDISGRSENGAPAPGREAASGFPPPKSAQPVTMPPWLAWEASSEQRTFRGKEVADQPPGRDSS
jgi:hypothetical protein